MSSRQGPSEGVRAASASTAQQPRLGPLAAHRLLDATPAGAAQAPLVLLHGFTGAADTWAPFVAALAARADFGRAVWAVDLVGHGRSPRPGTPSEHAIPRQAEDVAATLAALGLRRSVWLGYSMGGRVALTCAAQAPGEPQALVLVGASPGIADPVARAARAAADERLARAIEEDGLAAFVDRWAALPIFATQARLGDGHAATMRQQRLRNDPAALAASLRFAGQGVMPPLADELPGIAVPVLLVAGALDAKYRALAETMADVLPDGQVAIVPDAGHAVQLEEPAALAALVAVWLARRER
jgi:2-succinyl-6-hydroxy-2,4-cyclohexadiene-1-carboxylate synthase